MKYFTSVMKIIIAQTAGFCMGVKRAVDMALDISSRNPQGIFTLGPLIHNKQTIELLRERGAQELDETKPVPDHSRILIRAHGVPPQQQESLTRQGHEIIDGTCPKVKTVHKVIARHRDMGYDIVITGDEGHAEVIGLLGYAGNRGHLIHSVEDIARLPRFTKVCLVSQTTFDKDAFDEIANRFQKEYADVEVVIKKTICSATERRQQEIQELARKVDAIIVVGGKNSANTLRLAKIAVDAGVAVQHVETENDLNWAQLEQFGIIGITAGASTPNWMIQRIVDHLKFLERTRRNSVGTLFWKGFETLAHLNIFVATGAALLYYASCILQGFTWTISGLSTVFLYFFSMYLWNSLSSLESTQHHGVTRHRFYSTHKRTLFIAAAAAIAILLTLSLFQSRNVFYLMVFATVAGTVYHVPFVPKPLRSITRYANLKDIPTSRELFVALAWAVVITFLPHSAAGTLSMHIPATACFLWIFFLSYMRSLLFDLRDIEGDRIMGRETLVTIIGEKKALTFILVLVQAVFAASLIFVGILAVTQHAFSGRTTAFALQIPVLLYIFFFTRLNRRAGFRQTSVFNVLADGLFYCAGLLAALWSVILDRS